MWSTLLIGLIGGVLILVFFGGALYSAYDAKTKRQEFNSFRSWSNLRDLTMALQVYSYEYDGKLPPMQNSLRLRKILSDGWLRDKEAWTLPGTAEMYILNPSLSFRKFESLPEKTIFFVEPRPFYNSQRKASLKSGRVKSISDDELRKLMPSAFSNN